MRKKKTHLLHSHRMIAKLNPGNNKHAIGDLVTIQIHIRVVRHFSFRIQLDPNKYNIN